MPIHPQGWMVPAYLLFDISSLLEYQMIKPQVGSNTQIKYKTKTKTRKTIIFFKITKLLLSMLSKKLPLILRVSIFVINRLIDLAEDTERGSEFQAI